MSQLRSALRTIHADREWWRKVLVGGALWLTIVGWPIVEGHQLESIDNSYRGFPTPLPRWNDIGTKVVIGIFAIVIDFFFFFFPILGGGMLMLCGTIAVALTASAYVQPFVFGTAILIATYIGVVWMLSVSPVAKQQYVVEGELAGVLSGALIQGQLRTPARGLYLRARLLSLPPYLLAVALFGLSLWLLPYTVIGGLAALWLAFSALVYARLVAVQLYLEATRELERRRMERVRQQNAQRPRLYDDSMFE